MELKLKYLFIKKNLIRSNVRKLKALIKLYTDYIEYITVDYKEKLDKKVLKFKTKQYQIFQNTYYNYAEEKELFDVVYTRKLFELKTEYRLKFRAYREATRRKIAKLSKDPANASLVEELQNSIPAKEIELENKVKEIAESWVKEFELESQKRLAKQGENLDLNALKNEVEERIANYRKVEEAKTLTKIENKKTSFLNKIAKLQQKLQIAEKSLEKASEEYVTFATNLNERKTAKELAKAEAEVNKYETLLANAEKDEDKVKYEKILVTVRDKVNDLKDDVPDIKELIKAEFMNSFDTTKVHTEFSNRKNFIIFN